MTIKNILTERYKSNPTNNLSNDDFVSKMNSLDVNSAGFKYNEIQNQINKFQENLSHNEVVSICFAAYENKPIEIESISYHEPDLIYFYGSSNGNKVQIIQHISQLNFLLIAVKKEDSSTKQ